MKVEDIMTRDVLTVEPDTPIREVARILAENHISGLPVCDAQGGVLGVVSEGDILYKEYDPIPARTSRLFSLLSDSGATKASGKAQAVTAGEAMTSPPITLPAYGSVAEAARLMSEHRVNRLPVLGAQKLVGIVTRSDLLQAFVREDDDIRREIEEDVLRRNLWLEDPGAVVVDVERGAVRVTGEVATRSEAQALERLAARVPGVVSVRSELNWTTDDTTRKANRKLQSTR